MKLVIDCFKLVKGTGKSIGIYNLTKNLVENLAKSKQEEEIIVLGTRHNACDFAIPGVKFVKVKYNPFNKLVCIFWELLLVTIALKKIKPDKVLFPRGFAPLGHYEKEFVIIHDMIPFYYHKNHPGVLNPLENAYIMWRLKASARKCDGVLTDSEASKKEIIRWAKVDEKKVHVVYPGQNRIECSANADSREKYICAITSGLPHKNAKGIVEAYARYFEKISNPLSMVIIGLENVEEYSLMDEIKENIRCIKYLEKDEDMYSLIKESECFLFLSLIEGFGFPPLEAMQLGVPVICSNVSSIPEVVEDAAVLVNPMDCEAVADAITEVLGDKEKKQELIRKGYQNAERFRWEKRVEEYLRIVFEETN